MRAASDRALAVAVELKPLHVVVLMATMATALAPEEDAMAWKIAKAASSSVLAAPLASAHATTRVVLFRIALLALLVKFEIRFDQKDILNALPLRAKLEYLRYLH